jgi:hypothetical protein
LYEVSEDPAISAFAENGVFAYAQPDAARSGCLSAVVAFVAGILNRFPQVSAGTEGPGGAHRGLNLPAVTPLSRRR